MSSVQNFAARFAAISALVALTACGGGGDDNNADPAPQPTPVTSPAITAPPAPPPVTGTPAPAPSDPAAGAFIPSTIRASGVASTHPSGSLNRYGFDLLNAELSRCGFGFANQDARLDRSAKAHGDWMALNNQFGHTEDGTRFPNGFTGMTASDRARFQGYPNGAGENLVLTTAPYGDTALEFRAAEYSLRVLLAAPFHLRSLAAAPNDVGLAYTRGGDLGLTQGRQNNFYLTIVPASVSTQVRQDVSNQEIATYPCEGSTAVVGAIYGEDPNPVPGRNLELNPISNGVLVRTNLLGTINVTSFSMVEAGTTTPLRLLAPVVTNSSVVYFADQPLKKTTRYTVTTRGTAGGVAFNRTFTFTTGTNF